MGIIIETGSGVSLLKKGDRVVMPFNVADGRCRNCEEGRTAFCTGVNPYFTRPVLLKQSVNTNIFSSKADSLAVPTAM
jgi:threonine dehydrogenase-like Zn-dependent dehydrogenase